MTPRSASDVGLRHDEPAVAISAPIALASETLAPRSTIVSAWRALTALRHVARDPRVDLLGPLALVGREQDPEALLVRVERLLQVADGDLVGDLHEVDDAAPVRHVQERAEVALLEVEVDDADRPARAPARTAASARWSATVVVPTPPLEPATAIELAAERAAGRLLARDPVAHRARPLGGGAHAGLEVLERERERDDVAQPGLHGGAQQVRRVVGGDQDQPDLGEAAERSRASSITGDAAERVVQHDDVDVEPAQRAVDLVGVGDAVDDLDLPRPPAWPRRALG